MTTPDKPSFWQRDIKGGGWIILALLAAVFVVLATIPPEGCEKMMADAAFNIHRRGEGVFRFIMSSACGLATR